MRVARSTQGFTLVEMIVVVFLLALAMLGILAVFDASARINKSEQQVADAQGAVRYGIYQMTRAIRMAGAGGLFITQAVLNRRDPQLAGINVPGDSYDNVAGATVTNLAGTNVPVRNGTDMIEVRGVILTALLGFDPSTGCGGCTGSAPLTVLPITGSALLGQHYNDDATNRPQFAGIDNYTAGVSATLPMLVIVASSDDIHGGNSQMTATNPVPQPKYPQPTYNVGAITGKTNLQTSNTFGPVDFTNAIAREFNNENPQLGGTPAQAITRVNRAGILDDLIFFIDNTDPQHPALAQGTRRGSSFDIVTLADDVEDMQIAYGVGISNVDEVRRVTTPNPTTDPDRFVSNQAGGDEWLPNVPGEAPYSPVQFVCVDDPTNCTAVADTYDFPHTGIAPTHIPRLHGVMVSLLARSKDPDPTYKGPTAAGYAVMNAPTPAAPATVNYRRRVQTIKINLRNYASGN